MTRPPGIVSLRLLLPCLRVVAIGSLAAFAVVGNDAIAGEYRVNGVHLTVDRASVHGDMRSLSTQLLRQWRAGRSYAAIERREFAGKVQLVRRSGPWQQSVVLRTSTLSRRVELTSTMLRLDAPPHAPAPVPLLPRRGLKLASVIEELDAAHAQTFFGTSKLAPTVLTASVARVATAGGWTPLVVARQVSAVVMPLVWMRESQSIVLRVWPQGTGSRFVMTLLPNATVARR